MYNHFDDQPGTPPQTAPPRSTVDPARGKGGHVMVRRAGRMAMVPTGSGEVPTGTFRAILRQLGLRPDDLR
jgi:hypothetical protein